MFATTPLTLFGTIGIAMAIFFVLISEVLKVVYIILFI